MSFSRFADLRYSLQCWWRYSSHLAGLTLEIELMRQFSAVILSLVLLVVSSFAVVAKVVDPGPPYTNDQFLEIAQERLPNSMKVGLVEWWARAPDYLRKHVLNSPSERWSGIIKCNYFGFRPDVSGPLNSAKCEEDDYQAMQRGRNSWTADGQWIGPSDACVKRDKRTRYGELICD